MSDPTVTAFLTKLLCSQGGRIPRDQLPELLELPPDQIEQILQDETQKFAMVGDLVLARNPVRICLKYLKDETEEECDKLHLCRYYLQDKCRRKHCKFSHDITTEHNRSVLKDKEINGLNTEEIKVLLHQNDPQMLPEICWKHQRDSCDLGDNCFRLHVCDYFTKGECNRRFCKRSHKLQDVGADRCQMPEISLQNFQILADVKHTERLQSLIPEAQKSRGRPTKRGDFQDVSRSKSRGRQQERAGRKFFERSSSQATSENRDSHASWFGDQDGEWNEFLKTQQDIIMKNWFSSPPARSEDRGASFVPAAATASHIVQPSTSSGMRHPTPTVTTHLASPHMSGSSSQPGISPKLLTPASTPSAPQPKPTTTPVTTTGSVTVPPKPINLLIQDLSVEDSNKPVYPSAVKPPTVILTPSTKSTKMEDSQAEGPSFPPEKPVTTPITSPSVSQPLFTIIPLTPPELNPSLVESPMKGPSIAQEKPLTTSTIVTSIAQPAVTIRSVTTPTAPPSTLLSPSYPRLVNSSPEGPPVLHVKPIQSSVRYQPVPDTKPISRAGVREDLATTQPTSSDPHMLPKRVDPNKVPEICLSHLWKYCNLANDCPDMHYYLPYRWQIYKGTDWEDLPQMEEIEKCYCDPKVDGYGTSRTVHLRMVPLIDFLTMRSGQHRIRRLSTVSSVVKPSEYVLTTEWLWYWKDEYGTWTQYGHSNVKSVSSNILSSDLENVYLPDPVAVIPFTAGNQMYEINFREMKQKNVLYKTEKDVRRRPKYLSFDDVKLLRGSTKSAAAKSPLKLPTSPLNTNIYPKTWDPEGMPESGCKKVLVSDTSSEFIEIVSSFSKTVNGHEVKNLWRLQNPSLWQVFQWQKEQMKTLNQGRDIKQIRLFHGTDSKHIHEICNTNFDWRICGTHGTVYGQGSYFARDASYSHNYSTPTSSGTRVMFVARVLVGDYVTGNPQMKRPPLRPGSTLRYYDSCVDNTIDPSIFVVFEKHQIYPEYLLEYEEQKKSCAVC